MTRFLLTALAAIAVLSFLAPTALARTGDDERCRGGHDENDPAALLARTVAIPHSHREVHCSAVFDVPPSRGERVPEKAHAPDCPAGWIIRGTRNARSFDPDWDYFALRDEAVTWDPGAGLHLTYHHDGAVKNMRPAFFNHNARHSWPVRVFFVCEPERV